MAKVYKILVPKPGAANEAGSEVKLYSHDEVVKAEGKWQEDVLDAFVENNWAIEVKADSVEEEVEVPAEVKRARNEDGTLKGDDPSTPDVNEAWEGGEAPKKTTKKKASTKKKSTKKKSQHYLNHLYE